MFCTLDLRAARFWVMGVAAGLVGWAVWSVIDERGPWGQRPPMAFEPNFRPAQVLPASGPAAGSVAASIGVEPAPTEEVLPAAAESDRQRAAQVAGMAGSRGSPDELRAQRERLRSQEMELARQVLEDPQASEARKGEAQRQLLALLQRSRKELEIEQLLGAAGIADVAVSIGDSGVQVVVPHPVTAQGAARIGELVARMAGVRREDISIIDSLTAFVPQGAWQESGQTR